MKSTELPLAGMAFVVLFFAAIGTCGWVMSFPITVQTTARHKLSFPSPMCLLSVNFPCSDQRVVCRLALNLLKNRT